MSTYDDLNFEDISSPRLRPADNRPITVGNSPVSTARSENGITAKQLARHDRIFGKIVRDAPVKVSKIPDNTKPMVFIPSKKENCIRLTEEMLSKHLLFIGGIGCGKTNAINFCIDGIISNMNNDDVLIIFDTKGDFYQRFGDPNNRNHIVIGNHPKYRDIPYVWNIFDELLDDDGKYDDREADLMAREISKKLFENIKSESQPFFALAGAEIFKAVLIAFYREAFDIRSSAKLNNTALVDFFNYAEIKDYDAMFKRPGNEDMRSLAMFYGNATKPMTPQALGVFGTIKAIVSDLFVGVFASKNGRRFSMKEAVREKQKKVVFIEYDLKVGQSLGPIYSLLFDLALKQALGGRNTNKGNTYFAIDELRLLDAPSHLGDALNFGRSQNVKILAAIQSIRQLTDAYGEEAGRVVAAGFMNCMCFQSFDIDTRKYISDRFGEGYDSYEFDILGKPDSVQQHSHVVEDWDIMELDVGEAFVNLFGFDPFKFDFKIYKDKQIAKES